MTQKVSGKVFKVYDKYFPASKGKPAVTFYTIKLENDGTDATKFYYRAKKDRYEGIAEPGNYIEFEADDFTDNDAQIVKGTVRKVAAPKEDPAPGASGGTVAKVSGKDPYIHYQNARGHALNFIELVLQFEVVKLPSKPAERLEALSALLDAKTAEFYEDIAAFGAVERVRSTGTEDDKKETKPSKEEDDE